jgi:hypothetical protein
MGARRCGSRTDVPVELPQPPLRFACCGLVRCQAIWSGGSSPLAVSLSKASLTHTGINLDRSGHAGRNDNS